MPIESAGPEVFKQLIGSDYENDSASDTYAKALIIHMIQERVDIFFWKGYEELTLKVNACQHISFAVSRMGASNGVGMK